jgi:serine/threonine protein kinase/tetratricopeptide (TPR) repeat protein
MLDRFAKDCRRFAGDEARLAGELIAMTDPLAPLRAALAGHYEIKREIGQGAFATVYLAYDLKHERRVALKVLNADPTSETGELRFIREIRVLASLQHPNILPLHDSGHVEALLYYVMPYVEGETLRARIDREHQLPIDAAIGIAYQTADALYYAHKQGIVHRDIKPENILLSDGHPVIADFGIARAIDLAGVRQLTRTGQKSPGTPAYMSPEQLLGDGEVDARTDMYSLGCVLCEMLTGKPPFAGKDGFAKRFTEQPALPSSIRRAVPRWLDEVVVRTLSRNPADRYPTCKELLSALSVPGTGALRTPRPTGRDISESGGDTDWSERTFLAKLASHPLRFLATHHRTMALSVVGLFGLGAIAIAGGLLPRISSRPSASITGGRTQQIVVIPFCVEGSSDLNPLGRSMAGVVESSLPDAINIRPIDPATVEATWGATKETCADDQPQRVREIAGRLGAGSAATGRVIARDRHLVLQATVQTNEGSGWRVTTVSVEGSTDSTAALANNLAGQVTAVLLGEDVQRRAQLAKRSLTAQKFYLAGSAFYRSARNAEALSAFWQALDADSTFALAALGIAEAGGWAWFAGSERTRRGLLSTWALRSQLSNRDRAVFDALVGKPDRFRSAQEEYSDWEHATEQAPYSPTAWYEFGDRLYHAGAVLGISNSWDQAGAAFEHSLQLDSAFRWPLMHLIQLAIAKSDWTTVDHLQRRLSGTKDDSELLPFIAWRIAAARGNGAQIDAIRKELPNVSSRALIRIAGYSQIDGVDLPTGQAAANELARRASTSDELRAALLALHDMAINRGQYAEAARLVVRIGSLGPIRPGVVWNVVDADALAVTDAVIGGGDTVYATAAVMRLEQGMASPARSGLERFREVGDLCAIGLWRARRGQPATLPMVARRLRMPITARDSARFFGSSGELCASMLDAEYAVMLRRDDARRIVTRLDSLAKEAPAEFGVGFVNVVLADLWSRIGDVKSGLMASRRRLYDWTTGARYFAAHVRAEAELAKRAGDNAEAASAQRVLASLREQQLAQTEPRPTAFNPSARQLTGMREANAKEPTSGHRSTNS